MRRFGWIALACGLSASARGADEPPTTPLCEDGQTLVYVPHGKVDPKRAEACQA